LRQDFTQGHLGLEWGFSAEQAQAVGDAVHMHVDADGGLVETQRHHQVGGLATDSRQFAQFLDGRWQQAAEFGVQGFRQRFQVACLVAEEAHGVDQPLQLFSGDRAQFFRCGDAAEEPCAGGCCAGVLGARTEDCA